MLLLGAGESGKSTIFKQMKVINKNGYTEKERKDFIGIIHMNVCTEMKKMCNAFEKTGTAVPADLQPMIAQFIADSADEKLTPSLGELIASMWAHSAMKEIFLRRSEFQLNDSAEFYFGEVVRLSSPSYIPTVDDVLRSRVRTTGIVQSDFTIKNLNFSMFDVGGQRNERRKWIHCFDAVDAVVFVASLSEFDQVLYEDESKNRLEEALELFKQIINNKWFKGAHFILFLNKKDLFQKKLEEKTFSDYVKSYEGPNDPIKCADHIKDLFLAKATSREKTIYPHITTAIDTGNVKFVFNAVVAMILEENLKNSGLA